MELHVPAVLAICHLGERTILEDILRGTAAQCGWLVAKGRVRETVQTITYNRDIRQPPSPETENVVSKVGMNDTPLCCENVEALWKATIKSADRNVKSHCEG